MEYIPVLLTFASALVAIVGNTWEKNAIGLKRLTVAGRITLIFVVLSLIYSLGSIYQQRSQKQREDLEKKKIGEIISAEISSSLDDIAFPFRLLYIENNDGNYIPEKDLSFDLMLAESMLEKAQHTCLELRPQSFFSVPDRGTWHDIFRSGITSGIDRLDRLVDRYGVFMNAEMLDAIYELQVNGSFRGYTYLRASQDGLTKSSYALPSCAIGQPIGAHKQYLTMLKRIESLNDRERLVR